MGLMATSPLPSMFKGDGGAGEGFQGVLRCRGGGGLFFQTTGAFPGFWKNTRLFFLWQQSARAMKLHTEFSTISSQLCHNQYTSAKKKFCIPNPPRRHLKNGTTPGMVSKF